MSTLVERTAWHEAGHAVMFIDMNIPVRWATIEPYDDNGRLCLGHVNHQLVKKYPLLDWATSLAGPAAESWVLSEDEKKEFDWLANDADEINAAVTAWADENGFVPKEPGPVSEELTIKIRATENAILERLNGLRPKIEVVAAALMECGTLTGDEIKALRCYTEEAANGQCP